MVRGATSATTLSRRPYPSPHQPATPMNRGAAQQLCSAARVPTGWWCSAARVPAGSCCGAAESSPQPWCGAAKPSGYYGIQGPSGRINGCRGQCTLWVLGNPLGDWWGTLWVLGNPVEALQWVLRGECDKWLPRNLALDGRLFEKYFFSGIPKPYPSRLVHLSHPRAFKTLWVAFSGVQAPTPLPRLRSSILRGFGNFGTTHIEPVEYDDSVYW